MSTQTNDSVRTYAEQAYETIVSNMGTPDKDRDGEPLPEFKITRERFVQRIVSLVDKGNLPKARARNLAIKEFSPDSVTNRERAYLLGISGGAYESVMSQWRRSKRELVNTHIMSLPGSWNVITSYTLEAESTSRSGEDKYLVDETIIVAENALSDSGTPYLVYTESAHLEDGIVDVEVERLGSLDAVLNLLYEGRTFEHDDRAHRVRSVLITAFGLEGDALSEERARLDEAHRKALTGYSLNCDVCDKPVPEGTGTRVPDSKLDIDVPICGECLVRGRGPARVGN